MRGKTLGRTQAFALLETMLVPGIIGLLAALTFPVSSTAENCRKDGVS